MDNDLEDLRTALIALLYSQRQNQARKATSLPPPRLSNEQQIKLLQQLCGMGQHDLDCFIAGVVVGVSVTVAILFLLLFC